MDADRPDQPPRLPPGHPLGRALRALPWIALVGFALVLLRTAWLSDDAYISFRSIRNFVAGDGLRWNLAERVQVFTHPLWFFVLSALSAVTGELYYTTLLISIVISLATAWLLAFRVAPDRLAGASCVVVLMCSRSFVDFSTSGLENPLTHLLLCGFAWLFVTADRFTPRRLLSLSLLAGLAATNRLDTVLLVTPALAWAWWQTRTRAGLLALAAGFAPLAAWELFSIVYYGVPFPNTAYAKIPGTVGLGSRIVKGLGYVASSTRMDAVGMAVVGLGLVAPALRRRWDLFALSVGILLYVVYIVWVGGDFMGGRFFTSTLILAFATASRCLALPDGRLALVPAAAAIAACLALGARSPLLAGADYGTRWHWSKNIDGRKVADERAVYYKITGLLREHGRFSRPWHAWFEEGSRVAPGGVARAATVGFFGWAAPRDAFIVDQLGLGDAFIARLPPISTEHWRPGHLDRAIPAGYLDTRRSGELRLLNRGLAEYFEQLHLVTAGPLWSGERWRAIWRLNTGQLDELLSHHADIELPVARLGSPRRDGTTWNAAGNVVLEPGAALRVRLSQPGPHGRVAIAVDANDGYAVTLARGERELWSTEIGPVPGSPPGLHNYGIDVPAAAAGFDTIIIEPRGGDQRYSVGSVRVEP